MNEWLAFFKSLPILASVNNITLPVHVLMAVSRAVSTLWKRLGLYLSLLHFVVIVIDIFYDSDDDDYDDVFLCFVKTFENIKHIQVERYNKATTAEEKAKIECNPLTIFHQAVENCKPVLATTKIVKGGVTYQVTFSWSCCTL